MYTLTRGRGIAGYPMLVRVFGPRAVFLLGSNMGAPVSTYIYAFYMIVLIYRQLLATGDPQLQERFLIPVLPPFLYIFLSMCKWVFLF